MTPIRHLRIEVAGDEGGAVLKVWPDQGPPTVVIVPAGKTMPCELWGEVRDLAITKAGRPSFYLVFDGSQRAGTSVYSDDPDSLGAES